MIWVRGRIVPDDALAISVLDRTFEHGLGLFETLRTWSGQPTLLPRHLDRLTRSAAELGLPHDREALPDAKRCGPCSRQTGGKPTRCSGSRSAAGSRVLRLDALDAGSPAARRLPRG